jgi:hypothetical protein
MRSIYVENFVSKVKVTDEPTNERMYKGYVPGMETDITKAVSDRFLYDGNLKIAKPADADLILVGELMDFKREALRYDANDNVEEYRIILVTNLALKRAKTGETVWSEENFSGETTYRTGGSLAMSETAAVDAAADDLARRIVERTVEEW